MPTTKTTKNTGATKRASATRARLVKARANALALNAAEPSELPAEQSVATRPVLALPEPEELAKYEKIIPGGAERILELAEQQAAHHQEVEARQLETSAKLKLVKQIITFFLALGAGALGAALLLAGSELAGLLVIVIDAAALAAVSLYGHQDR